MSKKDSIGKRSITEKNQAFNKKAQGVSNKSTLGFQVENKTIGWTNCFCKLKDKWRPGIVLDPFMGSGTTALVARKFGRNWIGIELSKEYIKIANKRLAQQSLFENS